jgi:hypothetical protein
LFEDREIEYLTADLRQRRENATNSPINNNAEVDNESMPVERLLFDNALNFGNVENIPENLLREVPLLGAAYRTLGEPLTDAKISEIFVAAREQYDVKGTLQGIITIHSECIVSLCVFFCFWRFCATIVTIYYCTTAPLCRMCILRSG